MCVCPPGYAGLRCERPCPANKFGELCQQNCLCQNNAACEPVEGFCKCSAGYTGKDCSQKCPTGYFGINCQYKCNCNEPNTKYCDHVTGY